MVNFVRMQALAKKQIEANGRSVDLLQNPTDLLNPSEPERGPDFSAGPTPETVIASFVPKSGSGFGRDVDQMFSQTLLASFESVCLIAATSLSGANAITSFARLRDSGKMWKIIAVEILQPGVEEILYAVGLAK